MFALRKNRQSGKLTGIATGPEGTAIACVQQRDGTPPALQTRHFQPAQSDSEIDLGPLLKLQGLDRQRCSTVLPVGDYQLLVVDTPEVPAPEMRAAIRWRIHDMIDYHIDDAVLDVFDAPPGGPNNLQHQMYVVVARSATIKQRIDSLEQAGVNLEIIDIPELAMRNIATGLPEDENGLLMIYFDRDECIITITRQASLYLTRTLDIGYRHLQETAADPQPLVNRLTLEIQRSMDYYERHFQQAPVRALAILPPPVPVQDMADALQGMLGVATRIVKLGEVVKCDSEPETAVAAQYLLAAGAALRTEERAL